MIDKVHRYIQKYHMIEENDKIIVGVSGGADSVCLLFVLLEIQKKMPLSLYVVHINHKIREEAMEDADYVKELCRKMELPYFLVEEDVEALAVREHLSPEEAGRKVRYAAFEKVMEEQGGNKIAVAHNKNDRAETVLFNLFRGSSIRGLNGITPVRDQIIRPLLCVERKEIEQYLRERGITYCVDKTNGEDTYTRNRIRNHLLPYVEENISEQAVSHISDTAEVVAQTEEYLQKMTDVSYAEVVTTAHDAGVPGGKSKKDNREQYDGIQRQEPLWMDVSGFRSLDTIIQKYLIMKCMHQLAGSRKDITSRHVQDVVDLFEKPVSKRVSLPYQLTAVREYGKVRLEVQSEPRGESHADIPGTDQRDGDACVKIDLETIREQGSRVMEIKDLGTVEIRVFPYKKSERIPEKPYTKWFDYDRIDESLLARHRRTGDYLSINEEGNTKSLKAYMIDEKIPQEQRDKLYVFASGQHVIWLVGHRISQYYKVDQNTKEILEINIRRSPAAE
ncbi:MAG: tRNA lysidine(34) synthetase TilS [Lachnospiraceae bacterium]|nr:tRNA lysidine(34) synthetase TilS [Lachnospiraceae bacterium]